MRKPSEPRLASGCALCIQEAGGATSLMSTHDLLGKRQTLGTILIASRMTASQLQCQKYIQLAKEIYYQRQDGPWHWVNSVRHFYQFHQLFPAVTLFDCPTERTFFANLMLFLAAVFHNKFQVRKNKKKTQRGNLLLPTAREHFSGVNNFYQSVRVFVQHLVVPR